MYADTGFCCLEAAFAFRASLHPGGEAALLRHGHEMAVWAGSYLSRVWGTSVMDASEDGDMTPWMTNIELPFG